MSNIFLTEPKDRKFLEWLYLTEVFSKSDFSSFEKPEEGLLMPVLLNNSKKIDSERWISSALKSNPLLYYIPHLKQSTSFQNEFSHTLLRNLRETYTVIPLTQEGNTKWFTILYFFQFSIQNFCETLNYEPGQVAFNIVTPKTFSNI